MASQPPKVLKVGALRWEGDGPTYAFEPEQGSEIEIGKYVLALPSLLLDITEEKQEKNGEEVFVYVPRARASRHFDYQRKALTQFCQGGWDALHTIIGTVEEQGPRFNLCLPGEPPFPFSFKPESESYIGGGGNVV